MARIRCSAEICAQERFTVSQHLPRSATLARVNTLARINKAAWTHSCGPDFSICLSILCDSWFCITLWKKIMSLVAVILTHGFHEKPKKLTRQRKVKWTPPPNVAASMCALTHTRTAPNIGGQRPLYAAVCFTVLRIVAQTVTIIYDAFDTSCNLFLSTAMLGGCLELAHVQQRVAPCRHPRRFCTSAQLKCS